MTRTIKFAFSKILILFAALFMICNCAFAQDNLIHSVMISKPKELGGAYQLTIKADKQSEYKVKVDSSDSVYFDIKNSVLIENLDTIYDNVSGIDALIVQQLEKDKVRIYVNGMNTATTQLKFEGAQKAVSKPSNKLVLNRPIREYRPTADMEEVATEDINWEDNSFDAGHFLSSFGGLFGQKSDMTFVICLALLILTIVASRKIFSKIKISEEPLIGLSSAPLKEIAKESEFERAAFSQIPTQRPQVAQQRQEALQKTQDARAKLNEALKYASNSYERRKYAAAANANAQRMNLIKENYAMGAYEKSQRNPYVTRSTQPTSGQYQKRVATSPVSATKMRTTQRVEAPKKTTSVDNIKFLESVTKIYEQNGRGDLAQGLRSSIGLNR